MKLKKNVILVLAVIVLNNFLFINLIYAQNFKNKKAIAKTQIKGRLQEELIGGVINKSDLKLGFLNNGRFCAPQEFIPDLPSALYGNYGYLGLLDLWVGIPDGPWAPKVWSADSQKYVSLGPTVSGTIFEPSTYYDVISGTDWSTINATKGVFYTGELLYSDVYRRSDLFDFILAPTSEYEQTWPRNAFTGFREWPGKWRKDPFTGESIKGTFLGDYNSFISFDDKMYADDFYPKETYVSQGGREWPAQRGYSIGAEVLAQVIGFQDAIISNMLIFDLQIINTSDWDYHDVYIGLYYASDNPWYWSKYHQPSYPGLKNKFIKNEYCQQNNEVIPYNLSYGYNIENPKYHYIDPTYFGVQFLKTPVAENDLIDNDGDGLIDEPEGEQLGLTGWHYFYPSNFWYLHEREKLQYKLLSGDTLGLGNWVDKICFYRDSEGNLDPNFDYPEGIDSYGGWGTKRGVVWLIYDVMSCGPINWASGDTLNFVFCILVADDSTKLKTSARVARKIVQNNYHRSEGPPLPQVTAVPGDGKVTLYWDRSSESAKDFISGYHDFEGYKIYKTTSDPAYNDWGEPIIDHDGKLINFIPVASCDLVNGINGYEKIYPFQKLGDDTGLFHTWIDSNVTNGVTYWYSVCAYDHGIVEDKKLNPLSFPVSASQECAKGIDPEHSANLVKVVPGQHAANLKTPTLKIEKISETAGNGPIEAIILDPYAITGHDYIISFEDTTYGFAIYDLYDATDNKLLYEKVQKTSGEEGIIFDGIQLTVEAYDNLEILNAQTYWYNYETGGESNCTWTIFGDKLTWDPYPFEYEIRFIDHDETGAFTGKTAPFEIWNTELDHKCQWDIFFNAKTDTTDSMKAVWTSGDMIYIWDTFLNKNKFTIRVHITEHSYASYTGIVNNPPQPGDAVHFLFKRQFRTGDQFKISSTALEKKTEKEQLPREVKVVPNPFIVHAGWELNSNDARIQFINLPSECTIHIFSMSGEQVRTLYHKGQTDFEFWDLLNNSNLKVSYGLYIFVVETEDGKMHKGKFAVLR